MEYKYSIDNTKKWHDYLEFAALSYTKDLQTAQIIAGETFNQLHEIIKYLSEEDQKIIYATEVSKNAIKYLKQEILEEARRKQLS